VTANELLLAEQDSLCRVKRCEIVRLLRSVISLRVRQESSADSMPPTICQSPILAFTPLLWWSVERERPLLGNARLRPSPLRGFCDRAESRAQTSSTDSAVLQWFPSLRADARYFNAVFDPRCPERERRASALRRRRLRE